MSLLYRLPQIALVAALLVFTLTLFLLISSGAGFSQPMNIVFLFAGALSVFFMFLAQNPNNLYAAMMLWFGAGVWGAAAYVNFQMIGLLDLVVGLLAWASAFWVERESRSYSIRGPALFIGVAISLVILNSMLTR